MNEPLCFFASAHLNLSSRQRKLFALMHSIATVIVLSLLTAGCATETQSPVFSALNGSDPAFDIQFVIDELRYEEVISAHGAADSLNSIMFQPKRTVSEFNGTIYGNGSYTFTIYDRTSGDSLNALEFHPRDTSRRIRTTVINTGSVATYNALNQPVSSSSTSSLQQSFLALIDSILVDSLKRQSCGQGMLIGVITGSSNIQQYLYAAQQQGATISGLGNGKVKVVASIPSTLFDGTTSTIPNGVTVATIDTVAGRLLQQALFSNGKAMTIISYFYHANNMIDSENTEHYATMPNGTTAKYVTVKKYRSFTVNCHLNE